MNRTLHQHHCTRAGCHTPTQNYLCESCTTQLANMLNQLPWLLDQLDDRIQQLARITHGTIGRQRRPAELNVMDFDAAETARKVRKKLVNWVETIAVLHTGRKPPALSTVATKALARWLEHNVQAIALLQCAGDFYRDIEKLVGPSTERTGQLVTAINPRERHFAGPCPTIRGHNPEGEALECGTTLYADVDEETVTCPTCNEKIDVEANRLKARVEKDLWPVDKLLELLDELDEHVPRVTIYRWIRENRMRRKGFLHNGEIVQFRVRRGDAAVYSLKRARKIRDRERQREEATGWQCPPNPGPNTTASHTRHAHVVCPPPP